MKCRICGEEMPVSSYRKLYNYVNFPAHENWETCRNFLMQKNFEPLYAAFPDIVKNAVQIPPKFDEVVDWITNPSERLELLLQSDRLGELIEKTFPVVEVKEPRLYV